MKALSRSLAAVVALTSTAVWANAVDVSLVPRALVGKELPSISLHIQVPIAGFWLKLRRSDGEQVDVKGGGKPGQTRTIDLKQPLGTFGYEGELLVNFPDGSTSSMPLKFDAALLEPLHLTLEDKDVDLAARKVTFRLTRAAARAEVLVLMDTGQPAFEGEVSFDGAPAGTPLSFSWPEAKGKVMKIAIKAYDTEAFFTGTERYPWFIDIPHTDLNFSSGKADVRPEEAPKLDEAAHRIQLEVAKYGDFADVKLYVVGHTDTVGAPESNRTLSLNRARAIAQYFRKSGVRIPIFYEGYGEQALLVRTPDETDELKNRRAEYILSIEAPKMSGAPFAPNWRKL